MIPAIPVPPAEFTPYLLQQAAIRASLLKTSFGLTTHDWEDLRQDLALDCLRRLPNFDPARSDWRQFVHGVVRNQACVLASRQTRRSNLERLKADREADTGDEQEHEGAAEDHGPELELSIDVRRALASLPDELQSLALLLSESSLHAIRLKTGWSVSQLERKIRRIRAAFVAAGFQPSDCNGVLP